MINTSSGDVPITSRGDRAERIRGEHGHGAAREDPDIRARVLQRYGEDPLRDRWQS